MKFLIAVSAMAALPCSAVHAQWTVTSLHPPGQAASAGLGVGASGVVGLSQQGVFSPARATLWNGLSAASYVDMGPAGATQSTLLGVGGAQQVGYAIYGNSRAHLWTGSATTGVVNLAPPARTSNPGGARAVSEARATDGTQQAGWALVDGIYQAGTWTGTASSWTSLHVLGPGGIAEEGDQSFAYGVGGGQQVGIVTQMTRTNGEIHAALWTGSAASFVDLNPAGADGSYAYGVSGGQQVGFAYFTISGTTYTRGALWTGSAGSFIDLTPAGSFSSVARGVFGGFQVGEVDGRAAIWNGTAESYFDLSSVLSIPSVTSQATGVWTDGLTLYVSGTAGSEAVVWTRPIPTPSSISLLAVGGLAAARRRR